MRTVGVGVCKERDERQREGREVNRDTRNRIRSTRLASPRLGSGRIGLQRRRRRRMCPCRKLIVKIMMILVPTGQTGYTLSLSLPCACMCVCSFLTLSALCIFIWRCRCPHFIRSLILYRLQARIKTEERQSPICPHPAHSRTPSPSLFFFACSFSFFSFCSRYFECEKSPWRVKSFGFIRTLNVVVVVAGSG